MDYGFSEKRKNKNDRRAKSRYNRFKQGGAFRSANIVITNEGKKK
jgi:hypothetical protein